MGKFKSKILIGILIVFAITTFTSSFTYAGIFADKDDLREKIDEQYTGWSGRLVLSKSDYTSTSWSVYISKLEDAKEVRDNIFASQSQVDQALTNLNNAISGLVFAGTPNLNTAKSNAGLKDETDYTSESWQVLADALLLPETTNNKVVIKTTAINNAISGLVFAGTSNLNTAKSNAGLKNETDYTSESWKVLADALLLPETTNNEVILKTTTINNAVSGLVFAGQSDLDAAKLNAGLNNETDYTSESWKVLADALLLPETTNNEVVLKTTAINNAVSGLIFAGIPNLNTAKSNAALKNETDYTPESWKVLADALLLPETTNSEVVLKTTTINNTVSELVFVGQSSLNTVRSNAGLKKEVDYTSESWKVLANALLLPETTNNEVVLKTTAINNAVNVLVFAGIPNLNTAKSNAGLKKEVDYTPESWKVLVNALLLPETKNNEIVIKTTAINNAISGLVFAGKTNLDKAMANAATKVKTVYTVESWKALTDALGLAETTNNLVLLKTTAINNAINSLTLMPVKYKVTAYIGLNCRVFPNIYSPKVKAYSYGTILEITEIVNGWGKTKDGWISMNYAIKAVTTGLPNYIVTPYIGLNCRVSANINSNKITAYSYRTILEISEILNGWGKTQRGWVCMQYLRGI